jgi:predicted polyphosphate/ATP-dependent NAD kinase
MQPALPRVSGPRLAVVPLAAELVHNTMAASSPAVGIVINPFAGKDIRRFTSHAAPTSDAAKLHMIRRLIVGAAMGGAPRVVVGDDSHHLGERALREIDAAELDGTVVEVVAAECTGRRSDTSNVVGVLIAQGATVLLVMGGDGTCRDVAKAAPNITMAGIAAGTNNVFPERIDETLAGLAAALVATGAVSKDVGTFQAKTVRVTCAGVDGFEDLALVDLAVIDATFTGARAVTNLGSLRLLVTAIAEPACIGLAAIAAMIHPVDRQEAAGLAVHFTRSNASNASNASSPSNPFANDLFNGLSNSSSSGLLTHSSVSPKNRSKDPSDGLSDNLSVVRAVVAPGLVSTVSYNHVESVYGSHGVVFTGPAVLAFDGERDRVITASQRCTAHVVTNGPTVIDVYATLRAAARAGLLVHPAPAHPLQPRGRHAR